MQFVQDGFKSNYKWSGRDFFSDFVSKYPEEKALVRISQMSSINLVLHTTYLIYTLANVPVINKLQTET